jgi:hypothetical protein
MEFVELLLRDDLRTRSGGDGRRGVQPTAPVHNEFDTRIIANCDSLNAAAGVAHHSDFGSVELVVNLLSLRPFSAVAQLMASINCDDFVA